MISLPLLDAMVPALTPIGLTAASGTTRLGFVYVPNGVIQEAWLPAETGAGYEFPQTTRPLEPFRNQILLLSNLAQGHGRPIGDGGGEHSRASSTWLTGVPPKRTELPEVQAGFSADQLAAAEIGKDTRLLSVDLGLEASDSDPDSGYNGLYTSTISWTNPTTPNPMEINPRDAFAELFGKGEGQAAAGQSQRSVLDFVRDQAARLRARLGSADQGRLDQHLDTIRDLEKRIAQVDHQSVTDSYVERARVMGDLMVLAFQTDTARVASLMLGREASDLPYPSIGITEGHHTLSHHNNDPVKIAKVQKINELHVSLFAYVLDRMRSTQDGDGTLLDHTMMLYGSSLGDGNTHTHDDLPLVLAGGQSLGIRGGSHIRYAPNTPMNNLLVAMLHKSGLKVQKLGDATGPLDLASKSYDLETAA